MRHNAVKGMTVGKYFNPFYDTARRFVGFSPATIDQFLALGATATITANRVVELTTPDRSSSIVGSAKLFHGRKTAAWVNDFNSRSAK